MNPRLNAERIVVSEASGHGTSTASFADLLRLVTVHATNAVIYVSNLDLANGVTVQVLGLMQDDNGQNIQSNEPFTLSTTGAPSANSAASQNIAANTVAKLVIANPGPQIAIQIKDQVGGSHAACSAYGCAQ